MIEIKKENEKDKLMRDNSVSIDKDFFFKKSSFLLLLLGRVKNL